MYQVLARRYRPQNFEEVIGQAHIVDTIKNAIVENRVGHAYLFSGPHGIGKTSIARIFAKCLNCEKGPAVTPCNQCEKCKLISQGQDVDVIEIDAASNRLVEDARALRENVKYKPLRSRNKVYIIDEAHMLTKESFNTLLKVLEEPPPDVKFFFATTEPNKLLDTIKSRCQRFDLRRIKAVDITNCLSKICESEKIKVGTGVLQLISKHARGSLRDAESLLDKITSYKEGAVELKDVYTVLGVASYEVISGLVANIKNGDSRAVLKAIESIFSGGVDTMAFADGLIEYFRDLMLVKMCPGDFELLELDEQTAARYKESGDIFSVETLLYFVQLLFEAKRRIKEGSNPRIILEITLLKMSKIRNILNISDLLEQIEGLNEKEITEPKQVAPIQKQFNELPKQNVALTQPPIPDNKQALEQSSTDTAISPASVDDVKLRWQKVLQEVKNRSVKVEAWLKEGNIGGLDGTEIVVKFPYKLHRDMLEKIENKSILESAVEAVFGRGFSINLVLDEGSAESNNMFTETSKVPVARTSSIMEDSTVKQIIEFFNGQLLEVKPIEAKKK